MTTLTVAPAKHQLTDAEQNGYSHYETWASLYALDCWFDTVSTDQPDGGSKEDWTQESHDLYQEWQEYGDDDTDLREWIEDYIRDSVLSVECRTGWYQVGDNGDPEEFRLVFSTGGPHMEMRGKLDTDMEPCKCQVMVMSWGDPLHEIAQHIDSGILEFVASCFYFES